MYELDPKLKNTENLRIREAHFGMFKKAGKERKGLKEMQCICDSYPSFTEISIYARISNYGYLHGKLFIFFKIFLYLKSNKMVTDKK